MPGRTTTSLRGCYDDRHAKVRPTLHLRHKLPAFEIMTDITWDAVNAAIEAHELVLTGLSLDKEWYLSSK